MKTFIQSQFNYSPLVWMFHNRTLHHKINKLHERALRIVYKNDKLNFQELLEKDNSFTIHQRNLQRLAIEMFKIKNNLSPLPMQTWDLVPNNKKNSKSLIESKQQIKKWKPTECTCRLCKTYICDLGFLNTV